MTHSTSVLKFVKQMSSETWLVRFCCSLDFSGSLSWFTEAEHSSVHSTNTHTHTHTDTHTHTHTHTHTKVFDGDVVMRPVMFLLGCGLRARDRARSSPPWRVANKQLGNRTTCRHLFSDAVLEGIAVDPQSRLTFYTDAGNDQIVMMTMSTFVTKTVINSSLDKPRAIVVDTADGWVTVHFVVDTADGWVTVHFVVDTADGWVTVHYPPCGIGCSMQTSQLSKMTKLLHVLSLRDIVRCQQLRAALS